MSAKAECYLLIAAQTPMSDSHCLDFYALLLAWVKRRDTNTLLVDENL